MTDRKLALAMTAFAFTVFVMARMPFSATVAGCILLLLLPRGESEDGRADEV